MAGKNYKPALYELLSKGSIKPDGKGTLKTPHWFYGGANQVVEPLRKAIKIIPWRSEKPTGSFPVKSVKQPEPANSTPTAVAAAASSQPTAKEFGLHLVDKKLRVRLPYWLLGLIFMGLLLSHLVMYRLGQSGAATTMVSAEVKSTQDLKNAGPSEELQKILAGPVRRDLLPPPAVPKPKQPLTAQATTPGAPEAQGRELAASGTLARSSDAVKPVVPAPPEDMCLVMCGHEHHRVLRPVQEYYNQRGISAEIGRFDNRYVLYSRQAFKSSREADAIRLKNQVAELGLHYNSEKPKEAESFTAETFRTAFWVRLDRIDKVDN